MKNNEIQAFKKQIILLRTGVKEHCANYDPFGLCPCTSCFSCENSDYMVIASDYSILKDFSLPYLTSDTEKRVIYEIEFFDEGYCGNFEEYIKNEESDYRLTRIFSENNEEKVVLRPSKLDQEKAEAEGESEQYYYSSTNSFEKRKKLENDILASLVSENINNKCTSSEIAEGKYNVKTFIKKIFNRVN